MSTPTPSRRSFVKTVAALSASGILHPLTQAAAAEKKEPFKISLAQWSLNKRFFKKEGREPLDNLDFAKIARKLGIEGIEYVNQMFFDKATDQAYLARDEEAGGRRGREEPAHHVRPRRQSRRPR